MTRTVNAAKGCCAMLFAFALSACATKMGVDFDDQYAQQIKPGETTKADVRGKLGRPPLVRRKDDEETWTYAYYEGRGMTGGLQDWMGLTDVNLQGQGKQKRLSVTFKGDTVKESKFKQEIPITEDW